MKELKYKAWDKWEEEMLSVAGIDFTNEFIWINERVDDETNADTLYFDEIILLEYTGLKDKNGVEIYEGDVLSVYEISDTSSKMTEFNYISDVKWKDFGFLVTEPDDTEVPLMVLDSSRDWIGMEVEIDVVGNLYENPELVKE